MQMIRKTLPLLVLLGSMTPLAQAALNCDSESDVETYTKDIGRKHHPIGKPLPHNAQFNQPAGCVDGVWFFDLNQNARPDPDEPRLFGPQKLIGCSSCHGESSTPKSEASASVFLRRDATTLCLTCHRL